MDNSEDMDSRVQRPVHVIDHFPVRVSIWMNTAKHGAVWYSAVVTKRFKSGSSTANAQSEYGTTHSLSADDLLPAAQALEAAYVWIQQRRRHDHLASHAGDGSAR